MAVKKRRITLELSDKSIRKARKQLLQYQADMQYKLGLFVSLLINKGYKVAMRNKGDYSAYIMILQHTDEVDENSAKGILMAYNVQTCIREYMVSATEIKRVEVSPVLMAEFGSGWKAKNEFPDVTGVGQGTFPGQIHAFDPGGWSYMTPDGMWHRSSGEEPSMPMLKAKRRMEREITKTIKEVWK